METLINPDISYLFIAKKGCKRVWLQGARLRATQGY